ncbi:hypothetical protein [Vitiosangium sp. GDMCC 1.1324]|uniref:hypothetical protein n=1 Tax=Vitiosangium sp. (strain GDMCC 1.1324) TaxID=2138576 RepID=UPI00130DDEA4|nr:hypothetical protein [Vitiosangium sp. GDMCC 1.1324]
MYPDRFRLPQVTEHVLAWLERRRPGFGVWDAEVEAQLLAEARLALADVSRRFAEVAVDPGYWERLERSLFAVALPRYFQLAREHHALQRRKYGLWRGGDLLSRVAYTGAGIAAAVVIALTRVPDWLEPLPFAFILFGPFLPDMQESYFERRFRRQLATLVRDMGVEQQQLEAYRPLDESVPSALEPLSEPGSPAGSGETKTKEKA